MYTREGRRRVGGWVGGWRGKEGREGKVSMERREEWGMHKEIERVRESGGGVDGEGGEGRGVGKRGFLEK